MNYSPKDLESIAFKKKIFQGYDRVQVNNILAMVREDYDTLNKENDDLHKNIAIMKETVQHYKIIEESLQHTLILAQHTSESMKTVAIEKAKNIVKEAEISAKKIINEANLQVAKTKYEYEDTKKSLNAYKAKSQALLLSLLEILKQPFEEKGKS